MVRSLVVGFGYGYYDNVPAIYALKIMNMLIKVDATGVHDSHYVGFPTGYQSLWKAVADDLNRPVQLSSKVTSVTRSRGNGPIKVIVNGDSANEQELEFDAVIVSAPLSAVPSFVTLSDEEKALFAKVESSRYFITLFALPGAETGQAVFVHDNAFSDRINHAAVWANPGGGVPLFQAYQIAERTTKVLGFDVPLPAAAVTTILAADMLHLANGVFAGPLVRKEWPDYFPRVNKDALQAGFYDQVEALQGVKGLYYVGGTLSFETVETSARYAQSLVVDKFPTANLVVSGN
jgi:oxygen-dependent protoporphyrinogen oxidase